MHLTFNVTYVSAPCSLISRQSSLITWYNALIQFITSVLLFFAKDCPYLHTVNKRTRVLSRLVLSAYFLISAYFLPVISLCLLGAYAKINISDSIINRTIKSGQGILHAKRG